MPDDPTVEPLGPAHDRAGFHCGVAALDRYFHEQAGQDQRRLIASPFVLVMSDGSIGGYYTLSPTQIRATELAADIARRLPRYPLLPGYLLGRLAVDVRARGRGWGRYLLADALHRCACNEISAFALVVDAIDENARQFYEREGFLTLPDQPNRLLRGLSDIAKAIREDARRR